MTPQQAYSMLKASYEVEVEHRNRQMVWDDNIMGNIAQVAEFITGKSSKFGLNFKGMCGNGKTTMLYALQGVLMNLRLKGYFDEEEANGITKIALGVVDAKDVRHYAINEDKFDELKRRPLLAIEDLGREATEVLDHGNPLTPVTDLIEYRYNNQLFTVITTNLTDEGIKAKYGNRIIDRFNEMFEDVVFVGNSYRDIEADGYVEVNSSIDPGY